MSFSPTFGLRFAPKVLLPGKGVEAGGNDTLRQN